MGGVLSSLPRPALHARFPFLFIVNRRLTNLVSLPPGRRGRHEADPRPLHANTSLEAHALLAAVVDHAACSLCVKAVKLPPERAFCLCHFQWCGAARNVHVPSRANQPDSRMKTTATEVHVEAGTCRREPVLQRRHCVDDLPG